MIVPIKSKTDKVYVQWGNNKWNWLETIWSHDMESGEKEKEKNQIISKFKRKTKVKFKSNERVSCSSSAVKKNIYTELFRFSIKNVNILIGISSKNPTGQGVAYLFRVIIMSFRFEVTCTLWCLAFSWTRCLFALCVQHEGPLDHPGPKARGLQSKHGMFHSALPGTSSPLQSSHLGARPEGCHYIGYITGSLEVLGLWWSSSHHTGLRRCAPVRLNSSHPDHSPPPSRTTSPVLGPRYAGVLRPVEGGELVAVIAPLLHYRCCCCSLINRYVRVGSPRWGVDLGSQLKPVERTPETEQQGGRRKALPCRKWEG